MTTLAGGCGDKEPDRPLAEALVDREAMPWDLPKPDEKALDASAAAWGSVVAPDPGDRSKVVETLRRADFKRGTAYRYETAGADPRIYGLIQGVAEAGDPAALVRSVKKRSTAGSSGTRSRRLPTPGLGDTSTGRETVVGDVPIYAYAWKRDGRFYYVSITANPNRGPDSRDTLEVARSIDRKAPGSRRT